MQYPPNPNSINFELTAPHNRTDDNRQFVVMDETEGQERIVVFASNLQLKIMVQSEFIHMDGTFKACPELFAQLYIMQGYYRGECFPVCFVLMTNRTSSSYSRVFKALKIHALTLNPLGLNPVSFITDFEPAIKTAIELEFPLSNHYGCYFHLCQALLRYVSQNGMLTNLRENYHFAENFRLKCIAALFPSDKVEQLVALIDEAHPCPVAFKDYFVQNWLPKSRMISCFDRITKRTNNPSEGYNSGLNNKIPAARKNFWAFVLLIKNEEKFCKVRLEQLDDCAQPRPQKTKFLRRDNALIAWKADFDESDLLYQARKTRRVIAEN